MFERLDLKWHLLNGKSLIKNDIILFFRTNNVIDRNNIIAINNYNIYDRYKIVEVFYY